MKSVKPKDGSGEPPTEGGGRNAEANFHGQKRSNDTHASTTDPDARLPLPTRLMAGLAILKHMCGLSDEVLCERWVENPYYQLFCGEEFFRHELVIWPLLD